MRKLYMLFFALLITIAGIGQTQISFFAGSQATATRYTIVNVKQHNSVKYGIHAGLGFKIPFEDNLFFSPAVFYSMKGYKVKFNLYSPPPDINAKDNNTRIHCVETAALLQYDFSNQPDHFFIKVGPSLDFQLFGKERFNLISGGSVNRNMKYGFGDYGHFSANMLFQFGLETSSGFMLFAQYTHGMANISNVDGGPGIRHRVYGISVGKYFNRKKIVMDTRNRE